MSGCCDPSGYGAAFDRRTAERSARSYARRGLDSTAGPMVDALSKAGLSGASIIEVGAGAGTALASMFGRGARSAVGIDLSPHYEEVARELLAEHGHEDDVSWHTGDFVELAHEIPRSDVVFLNRVVCCYPSEEALLEAAADRAVQMIALSYPRDRLIMRIFMRIANWWLRLSRTKFRVFLHDPETMTARVRRAGFERASGGHTLAWEWNVWKRPLNRPT